MPILDLKKQVKIIDYAASLGFHPIRVGRYYSLKEHDSVRIDADKNLFYRNATGECGSVIDFVMTFTGKTLGEAIKELESYSGNSDEVLASAIYHEESKRKGLELNLPQKANSYKNVYAYLTKTRGIAKAVVNWMLKNGFLYQDIHKNCVFVSYKDHVPVFASLRGTNTYKRFLADVLGSDYSYGLYYKTEGNTNEKRLSIFESAIDMMSYITLLTKNGSEEVFKRIINHQDYLVLSGVSKRESLWRHLENGNYRQAYLCLDNDEAGQRASYEIADEANEKGYSAVISFPNEKDWNEELLKRTRR